MKPKAILSGMKYVCTPLAAAVVLLAPFAFAELKTEHFDADPGWEGRHNRIIHKEYPTITQNFGYNASTNFAGKAAGELGGEVTRASEPAFYGDKIGPKTLDDKLSAAGTFAITKTTGGGGVFFGFFR